MDQSAVTLSQRAGVLRSRALRIPLAYALFATLWIWGSDQLLAALVTDPAALVRISVYKGIAFVLVTAALLWALTRATYGSLERALSRLQASDRDLRARESELSGLIDSAADAILSFDREGRVQLFNPAAARMFRCPRERALGRHVEEFVLASMNALSADIVRAAAVREGGGMFQVEVSQAHFENGHGRRTTLILRDVSARLAEEERQLAMYAHAATERRFSDTLIDSMPGVVYCYDERGRFLRWNRNFERASGYSAEQVAAMQPLDFFAEHDREVVAERIAEVFARGESAVVASLRAQDGRLTPYLFTGRRVTIEEQPCLVGVGIDISERVAAEQALQQSERRLRDVLDRILEGCQLLDRDWHYLYLNPAVEAQNRRPNAELLGRRFQDSWPGIEATRPYALMAHCMSARETFREEVSFQFPDATVAWFDFSGYPVPEGILVMSIETTERRRAEQALQAMNQRLEATVAERTAQLQVALARAEAADTIKSAFLATMSHELRTPLNSIIGFTGILLQGLAGPLSDEQRKQLGMVMGSARHLLELINDVLDLSKIEAGQLQIRHEPVDVGVVVERVLDSVRPQAQHKQLTLNLECPEALPEISGDRRRIEQILLNLLSNAIKFTDRGGVTLCVEVVSAWLPSAANGAVPSAAPDARPALRFRVLDTGIGIAEDELAQLFQPFRQVDSGIARQHEGTGLGLAICRRLAGLMGGEIAASSRLGGGSEFTLTLPLQQARTT